MLVTTLGTSLTSGLTVSLVVLVSLPPISFVRISRSWDMSKSVVLFPPKLIFPKLKPEPFPPSPVPLKLKPEPFPPNPVPFPPPKVCLPGLVSSVFVLSELSVLSPVPSSTASAASAAI